MTQIYDAVNKIPHRILIYIAMLAGIVIMYNGFLIVLKFAPEFSMLPYKWTIGMINVATVRAIDDFVLTKIHTYNLLKRNPIGYAIYFLSYALAFVLPMASA